MPDSSPPPTPNPADRGPLFWQVQFLGWSVFALLLLPIKQAVYGSWTIGLLITAYQLPLSLGLTGLLRQLYRRNRPDRQAHWITAAVVLGGCSAAGAADVLASLTINRLSGLHDTTLVPEPGLYAFRTAIYLIWSLAYFLVKAVLQNRELAFHAAVAGERHRFELMRYQLNPNFLAKSLTTIAQQIGTNPATARAMATRLSDFYQNTLRQTDRGQPATVRDELALLRAYLDLERLRLGAAGPAVHYDLDESLLGLPLPPVLLLPLAEKAILSGRNSPGQRLEITVTVQRVADGHVLLEVSHSGRLDRTNSPFEGTAEPGADIRASLDRHFAGRYRFNLSQDSFRVRASLWLPLMASA